MNPLTWTKLLVKEFLGMDITNNIPTNKDEDISEEQFYAELERYGGTMLPNGDVLDANGNVIGNIHDE